MATIWITYAWDDNKDGDVDYIAQELTRSGLTVKLDRWNLQAGKRLWEQIASEITNPHTDAWVLYATETSLGSEACKEEFAIALDRALSKRGKDFPVIGLFPSSIENSLIPPSIRNRPYVSTTDPDWKERIKAAAENKPVSITSPILQPYALHLRDLDETPQRHLIEVRPRAGTWSPFVVAIPLNEKASVNPLVSWGPKGQYSPIGVYTQTKRHDENWYFIGGKEEATPSKSYFVRVDELPSEMIFGQDPKPQYHVVRKGHSYSAIPND